MLCSALALLGWADTSDVSPCQIRWPLRLVGFICRLFRCLTATSSTAPSDPWSLYSGSALLRRVDAADVRPNPTGCLVLRITEASPVSPSFGLLERCPALALLRWADTSGLRPCRIRWHWRLVISTCCSFCRSSATLDHTWSTSGLSSDGSVRPPVRWTAASPAPWRSGNLVLSFLSGAALLYQLLAVPPAEQPRRSGFPLSILRAWAAATPSFSLSRYVTVSCPVVRQFTCLMVRFNKVWVNRICLVNCTKDGGGLILAVWWVVKYRYTAERHPLAERHDTAGRHLAAAYSYTVERHRLVERHDTAGRHLAAAYSYTVERHRDTGREYTAVQRPTTARWNTAACRHTGIREDDVAAYAAGSGWLRMTDYVYIARWLTSLKVIEKRTVIYSSDRIYACALASYTTPPIKLNLLHACIEATSRDQFEHRVR